MATYFDATNATDKALLHPDVQAHSDLSRVAAAAERDVIRQFRRQDREEKRRRSGLGYGGPALEDVYTYTENGISYTVYLIGYEPDAEDAAGYDSERAFTGFAAALRQTIADVVSHRLLRYDDDGDVTAETHGRESWQYRSGRDTRWPRGWDAPLRDYIPARNDPRTAYSL